MEAALALVIVALSALASRRRAARMRRMAPLGLLKADWQPHRSHLIAGTRHMREIR